MNKKIIYIETKRMNEVPDKSDMAVTETEEKERSGDYKIPPPPET